MMKKRVSWAKQFATRTEEDWKRVCCANVLITYCRSNQNIQTTHPFPVLLCPRGKLFGPQDSFLHYRCGQFRFISKSVCPQTNFNQTSSHSPATHLNT